jgi:hypothetical protein
VTRYRVVHWNGIPTSVEAEDGERTVRVLLSPRFQELIDAVAMRQGLSGSEAYLDGWGVEEERERPGSARSVAEAVAGEFERGYDGLAAERLQPREPREGG